MNNETVSADIAATIKQAYPTLSKRHKIIADYILNNYDKAVSLTATNLGNRLNISESTVVRFAHALGYEGYPQLQRELQEYVRRQLTSLQRMALSNVMDPNDVYKTVLREDMHNIRATMEQIDTVTCNEVVEKILSARKVFILGLRSSAPLAQFIDRKSVV